MQFTRDNTTDLTIRRVERGSLQIGDETITGNVALTAEKIIRDWPATRIEDLSTERLATVLAEEPELIVLGTGWEPKFPPRELMFALARRGVGLETMDTPAACRTFNILVAEGRRPAAVLLLDPQ